VIGLGGYLWALPSMLSSKLNQDPRTSSQIRSDLAQKNKEKRKKKLEDIKARTKQRRMKIIDEQRKISEDLDRRFPFFEGTRRIWVTAECKNDSPDSYNSYCSDELCRCLCHEM
jgi:hypothetical protein